jgi:hypothetical protein
MDRNANVRTPKGTRAIKENRRRTFELERGNPIPLGRITDLDDVASGPEPLSAGGYSASPGLDDGFAYHYDYDRGMLVPAHKVDIVFKWYDPISEQVGQLSGKYPMSTNYTGKVYLVQAAVIVDPDDDIEIGFYCAGARFTTLTLSHGGSQEVQGQQAGGWPVGGGDSLQAKLESYSGSLATAGLTANIRAI